MADVEDLQRQVAELQERLDQGAARFSRLIEIGTLLNSTLKLDDLLQLIMSSASELLGAETSSLMLRDEETNELTIEVVTQEQRDDVVKQRVPAGVGIAGWVVEHAEPVLVNNARDDSRFYTGLDDKTGFETRSIVAVPLSTKERVVGVVEIINKLDGDFDESDVEVATALANQAGVAIDNARLYARLADAVVTSRLSYRL
jgi:GAF domain-containing protein